MWYVYKVFLIYKGTGKIQENGTKIMEEAFSR